MRYETDCRLCGVDVEWAEPHALDLPDTHPEKQYAWTALCEECGPIYEPGPVEDWQSIRFERTRCRCCEAETLRWIGTAGWANWGAIRQRAGLDSEVADEAATDDKPVESGEFGEGVLEEMDLETEADLRTLAAKTTSICKSCVESMDFERVVRAADRDFQSADVQYPMWEPIEDVEIDLDDFDIEETDLDEFDLDDIGPDDLDVDLEDGNLGLDWEKFDDETNSAADDGKRDEPDSS